MESKFSAREHLLVLTTGPHVVPGPRPNLLRSWALVLEEVDETVFWLELMLDSGIFPKNRLNSLLKEANELTSIFVTSLRTAKGFGSKA